MVLKPQDLLVALAMALHPEQSWSLPALVRATGVSLSEVHAAVRRCQAARLLGPYRGESTQVLRANLLEFLEHGAKYAFPPERGGATRGMPTAHAAPVLKKLIAGTKEAPPVWPDPEGTVRGESFSPLYKSAPKAAAQDARLYDALALFDAIRGGAAREREIAGKLLRELLSGEAT